MSLFFANWREKERERERKRVEGEREREKKAREKEEEKTHLEKKNEKKRKTSKKLKRFLDRLATHILAFEGDSKVVWFEGGYSEYEQDFRKRTGNAEPTRVKYRKMATV